VFLVNQKVRLTGTPHTDRGVICVKSDFRVNTLLARSVGPKEKSIMSKISQPSEVVKENIPPVTKEHLKEAGRAEFDAFMKQYEELCLASFNQTKNGVIKKNPLLGSRHITFSGDPGSL
jgi:hypothetical protein